jgi:hypothetical protein
VSSCVLGQKMKERYMAEQVNKEMQIISKATVILILSE